MAPTPRNHKVPQPPTRNRSLGQPRITAPLPAGCAHSQHFSSAALPHQRSITVPSQLHHCSVTAPSRRSSSHQSRSIWRSSSSCSRRRISSNSSAGGSLGPSSSSTQRNQRSGHILLSGCSKRTCNAFGAHLNTHIHTYIHAHMRTHALTHMHSLVHKHQICAPRIAKPKQKHYPHNQHSSVLSN